MTAQLHQRETSALDALCVICFMFLWDSEGNLCNIYLPISSTIKTTKSRPNEDIRATQRLGTSGRCVSAAWLLTALLAEGSITVGGSRGGCTSVWLKTSLSDLVAFSSGAALRRAVIHFHDSTISITLSGEDKYVQVQTQSVEVNSLTFWHSAYCTPIMRLNKVQWQNVSWLGNLFSTTLGCSTYML